MKKYHNMTGEEDFEGNVAFFKENQSKSLSWLDVFWLLAFAFFTIGFFIQSNRVTNLQHQLEEEKLLIMDLQKLYSKKK